MWKLLLGLCLLIALPVQGSNAQANCQTSTRYAVVLVGLLPDASIFNSTIDEMVSDFEQLGYSVIYLEQPKSRSVKQALTNPCVSALGVIGDGIEDSAIIGLDENNGMAAVEVQDWMKNRPALDFVILHSCHQGSSANRPKWLSAFKLGDNRLYAWKGEAKYFQTYWWQRAF